jgi:hypothetical protein
MIRMRPFHVLALAALAVRCAPPAATGAGPTRDSNVITREEIVGSQYTNAYDVVSRLRPAFLHTHGKTTIAGSDTGYAKVYLNHQYYGEIESLRTLDVATIREIRYYDSAQATNRFGTGNVSGAIEVITGPAP